LPKAKKPRKPKLPACITAPTYKAAAKELRKIEPDLLQHILLGSGDMRFIALAHELAAPKYAPTNKWTLTELLGMHKIKAPDIAKLVKDEMLAIAQIQQMQHAPDILETNAVAAIGRKEVCGTCRGKGRIVEPCPRCKGTGKVGDDPMKVPCLECMEAGAVDAGPCLTCAETGWVQNAGDPNALKVFAESAGLSGRGSPLMNVNFNQFNGAGSFEDLMARAEKPRANVIEATKAD
jgi:hypothetical protein